MTEESSFNCKIFIGEDEIYSGDLSEVPSERRKKLVKDLLDWADTLGKSGLNELLYSHLSWYEKMETYCSECSKILEDSVSEQPQSCEECGGKTERRYVYPRSEKLDKIITCTGLITEIRVSGS